MGRKPSPDRDYDAREESFEPGVSRHSVSSSTDQHKCHMCKKVCIKLETKIIYVSYKKTTT